MVGSFVCSVKDFLLISAHDSPFGVVKARGRSSRIASCIWIHFRNPQLKWARFNYQRMKCSRMRSDILSWRSHCQICHDLPL
jgi:hypothetical protein